MKIQDMVLVIENIKGKETNMLMTLKEYKEAYLFKQSYFIGFIYVCHIQSIKINSKK